MLRSGLADEYDHPDVASAASTACLLLYNHEVV